LILLLFKNKSKAHR